MMRKGQSGLEYMIIVIIAMLLITPVILKGTSMLTDMKSDVNVMTAKGAINEISDAAESVFAQGEPAKITVNSEFPENINQTYVGSREIMIQLNAYGGVTDIVNRFDFNVTGYLPQNNGRYDITIRAVKILGVTWVNITGG
ncbi:MAG: hypothetical protein KAJ20_02790 [Candidatus Aenigmarchaeota archaeon]|nr:hypothetical protein [Candidatus Aenigmarchaeota archaeon]